MSYLKEIENLTAKYKISHSEFYEIDKQAYNKFLSLAAMCDSWPDKEADIFYQFNPEKYDGEFIIVSVDLFVENQHDKDIVFVLSKNADYMSFNSTKDGKLCTKIGVKNVWLKLI